MLYAIGGAWLALVVFVWILFFKTIPMIRAFRKALNMN